MTDPNPQEKPKDKMTFLSPGKVILSKVFEHEIWVRVDDLQPLISENEALKKQLWSCDEMLLLEKEYKDANKWLRQQNEALKGKAALADELLDTLYECGDIPIEIEPILDKFSALAQQAKEGK